jgi:hypothetical protein
MKQKNDGSGNIIIETKNDSTKSQCEDTIKRSDFYVYALIDPDDNLPFYVGKGIKNRDTSHIRETMLGNIPHGNKHLYYTIKKIVKNGKSVIVERWNTNLNEDVALIKEVEYIKKYGRRDLKTGILTNLTNGGEGQSGWIPDDGYKKRMSIATSGKKNGMFGRVHTKETRDKIAEKARNRVFTDEMRKTWSLVTTGKRNPFCGKKHTEETKVKLSLSLKNRKRGKENGCYVDLSPIRDGLIEKYINTKSFSETTRYANSCGIKCSRVAIKRRLKEWNIT